ncbi:hypothetical protein CQA62_05375 [Helicobacter cholecystus]|uniref:Response regulatory domain-containing protein n=1 Tax=Helicobacter cholecystus TaxID=45498 RepID=A0A3D8IU61_9HELI|nr:response regulator [Helicobacter cholecystus]RDU68818.1 hypothetical protein CQA62_05375 [Helicobacter cholecystus]VEJ23904.1 two-component regulator [Helicobacter cholecystus]
MTVLVIENEIYLAQSIATRLGSLGYECHIVSTIHEAMQKDKFNIILLSSNAGGSLCEMFIRQNSQAIIIMMIAYVSEDTVTKPLKAGAKDYILKPFMIDELIRKINHQKDYLNLTRQLIFYEEYFSFLESEITLMDTSKYHPPFVIKSNSQKAVDVYVIKYAKERKLALKFSTLKLYRWKDILQNISKDITLYITHSENLKKNEFKELLNKISGKNVIVSIITDEDIQFPQVIDLAYNESFSDLEGNILPIKEYEKRVIQKFENIYSDAKLAEKMGISRKNLWEKRKRYRLERKKETDTY